MIEYELSFQLLLLITKSYVQLFYDHMDWSPPGISISGDFPVNPEAAGLPRDLPDSEIVACNPHYCRNLPSESPGASIDTWVVVYPFFVGIFQNLVELTGSPALQMDSLPASVHFY